MDEFEETRAIAISESRSLLEECDGIMSKGDSDANKIAEIFQKVHTAKSNMALIPRSKSISTALQNLETVLANLRDKKLNMKAGLPDVVLRIIDLCLTLLENIQENKINPDAEKEINRLVIKLRMGSSLK